MQVSKRTAFFALMMTLLSSYAVAQVGTENAAIVADPQDISCAKLTDANTWTSFHPI